MRSEKLCDRALAKDDLSYLEHIPVIAPAHRCTAKSSVVK